jgi:hypothetical protein
MIGIDKKPAMEMFNQRDAAWRAGPGLVTLNRGAVDRREFARVPGLMVTDWDA